MPQIHEIPEEVVNSVLNGTAMESDIYRIAYGTAFDNMNNQAMSLGDQARKVLTDGDVTTAADLIGQAYRVIEKYETSELAISGKTSGIRKYIGKVERKLDKINIK